MDNLLQNTIAGNLFNKISKAYFSLLNIDPSNPHKSKLYYDIIQSNMNHLTPSESLIVETIRCLDRLNIPGCITYFCNQHPYFILFSPNINEIVQQISLPKDVRLSISQNNSAMFKITIQYNKQQQQQHRTFNNKNRSNNQNLEYVTDKVYSNISKNSKCSMFNEKISTRTEFDELNKRSNSLNGTVGTCKHISNKNIIPKKTITKVESYAEIAKKKIEIKDDFTNFENNKNETTISKTDTFDWCDDVEK